MKVVVDAKTGEVTEQEYTPPAPTEELIRAERINEIQYELNYLDKTITRPVEDLYTLSGFMPYLSTAQAINRKKELREELEELSNESNN